MLTKIEVSEEIFNKILYDYEARIIIKKDFGNYVLGYSEKTGLSKNWLVFDGENKLICREYIVNGYCHCIKNCTNWKQVILEKSTNATGTEVLDSISGKKAFNILLKILKGFYSEQEIDSVLRSYEAEYNQDLKQFHYFYPADLNKIYSFENTYKFDINGAHADAIISMFPKAQEKLLELYSKKAKDPTVKKIFNYFVGYLCKMGYRKTYNWIVQKTTKTIFDAIDYVGGQLLYANTDGFCVKDPVNLLSVSKTLGEFKLEASGNAYIYRDKNYQIIQTYSDGKKTITGSCMNSVRDDIDLSKGEVVHYEKVLHVLANDESTDKHHGYFEVKNIIKENLNESRK